MTDTLTLSSKFQIAIPKAVRERLDLHAGQVLQIITYGDRIELLPQRDAKTMRGFLRGIDTDVDREKDRL
ncbi:AbrB/MazE/SpoVT family DNA-binding domain-containing protein [Salinisphaera sp.]|uniref:AbrB/MazE/SpoVT family DNA-binding domain-containing protein n=1 Tax=Salinisphaera sp. TaxID=1914330 RepID=UPI002D79D07E|nr:AbrB/MazE/SpoVT family DNA-binding domain-containing protein [Salinisphaera sp.]HET7313454.1 AbrB/MazE/SpoVT family DNA-binding domain-containing protein [Salinisphaera sp.]